MKNRKNNGIIIIKNYGRSRDIVKIKNITMPRMKGGNGEMKKAYLIVDMSNDFVADDGKLTVGKEAQRIVPNIIKTADTYFENGDMIIFCHDCHEEDDRHFEMWPPHSVKYTRGMMPYGALMDWYDARKGGDQVLFLPKSEYDAFYKTPLAEILQMHHVEHVRIAGVCTDICVYHTIYGAYRSWFKTEVARDECATFTPFGDAFLQNAAIALKTEIV